MPPTARIATTGSVIPMNIDEFMAAVERDRLMLAEAAERLADPNYDPKCKDTLGLPVGIKGCDGCGIPLQESVTGNRRLKSGRFLCSDCYFEEFGDFLEKNPISAYRSIAGR